MLDELRKILVPKKMSVVPGRGGEMSPDAWALNGAPRDQSSILVAGQLAASPGLAPCAILICRSVQCDELYAAFTTKRTQGRHC